MLFHNSIPITDLGQQWIDDDVPPDEWYHDAATGRQPVTIPDDFYQRYLMLIVWLLYESYWDQCIRQAKVSHKEYQFIVEYITGLETEESFTVPAHLTGVTVDLPIQYCVFDNCWSRYPQFIIDEFKQVGIARNPTTPLDDERHPLYNEYAGIRNSRKPKPKIERITSTDLVFTKATSLVFED